MNKMLVMACAIVLAASVSSCKSKYTLSQNATVAHPAAEEVTPVQYEQPAPVQQAPAQAPVVMPGDRQEKVTVVGDGSLLKNYNVIVGSFGSKANAENMKVTMISRGYNSFLVQNAAGMYRVVAGSFDTREAATSVRDIIRNAYPNEKGTCAEAWLLIPEF